MEERESYSAMNGGCMSVSCLHTPLTLQYWQMCLCYILCFPTIPAFATARSNECLPSLGEFQVPQPLTLLATHSSRALLLSRSAVLQYEAGQSFLSVPMQPPSGGERERYCSETRDSHPQQGTAAHVPRLHNSPSQPPSMHFNP